MNSIRLDWQFHLVKFPTVFPIIYGILLYSLPSYETFLITITILLLAETHFGATWPFFLDKVNYPYISQNRIPLIIIPILIVVLSTIGFFFVNKFFLLIFFAVNMYHVTRQSFGVCKLYSKDNNENKFQEKFIYFFNILFFLMGFFRFYIPIINTDNIVIVNTFIILLFVSICAWYLIKYKFSDNFLTFLTGCLIFSPVCFVDSPVHVITMGVTMHYTQYLYLTYNINSLRNQVSINEKNQIITKKISKYLIIIFLYSLLMTTFSLFGKFEISNLKYLILISILGQMIHFYLDSQLWKFSVKSNRDNTLIHIKKFIG